jgi:LysR family transcriptional activator of nhaA
MFNFNHLHYFYVVARSDSLTIAAKELQVSQPALSSQIKTFEASLGRRLFVRVGRGLQLTSDGKMAFSYCRRIFDAAADLSQALKLDSVQTGERITFGVSDELDRPFAAEMASYLLRKNSGQRALAIRMNSADHFVLLEQLLDRGQNRGVDVVLTNQPASRSDLIDLLKIAMPVRAYTSPNLIAARNDCDGGFSNNPTDNFSSNFGGNHERGLVLPSPGQILRAEAEHYLYQNKHVFRGQLVFEGNVMASLVRAVVDGMGIGFFPKPYVTSEIKAGRLVEISDRDLWHHHLYLIGSKQSLEQPRISRFRDDIRKNCIELGCKIETETLTQAINQKAFS